MGQERVTNGLKEVWKVGDFIAALENIRIA